MKHSTNYNFNLPDKADQYDLEHWNENTEKTDTLLKQVNDKLNTEITNRTNGDTEAKNLENATGILAVEKGGTGKTSDIDASNMLLNALRTGQDTPEDGDYYISQWAGGSELPDTDINKKTYVRRPISALWEYIRSKISSVLGLTSSKYNGTSAKAMADDSGNNIVDTYATKTQNNKRRTIYVGEIYNKTGYYKISVKGYYARQIEFAVKTTKSSYDKFIFGQNIDSGLCIRLGNTPQSKFKYIAPTSSETDGVFLIKSRLEDIAISVFYTSNYYANECVIEESSQEEWDIGTDFNLKDIDTYAIKRDIETTNDLLLRFTRITRVTPPSFASLLGARALYSENGGLKQIIVALKANQTYDVGNTTFSFSFIYGVYNYSGMSTFIGGCCNTVPADIVRNSALNSYKRSPSQSTGECVHTIEINNGGVEANDIITVYLNYL